MLGAIIGDVVGSVYEFHNTKTKDFPLFSQKSCFTDDTILTCAVAEWLIAPQKNNPADFLKKWGVLYKDRTYEDGKVAAFGKGFSNWLETGIAPNSKTNGCVMRISPVFALKSYEQALEKALEITKVTHNHQESLAAVATYVKAGFMLKDKVSVQVIKNEISQSFGYDLSKSADEIRPDYNKFYCSCKNSVPQAMICALDAASFEDAIRTAVSLGGDSDTLAAMAGGLAEQRFGVPNNLKTQVMPYLDSRVKSAVQNFYAHKNEFVMQKYAAGKQCR